MNGIKFYTLTLLILLSMSVLGKEYHVSVKGNDRNDGSELKPFKTITAAVAVAYAGDTITVHAGTYREWINPIRGGESDSKRIVYRAAPGEKAEIKGSEIINNWKKVKKGVWKVTIPNAFFGDYNPYIDTIGGDWFLGQERIHHTGEVFLNGKSFYEKESLDKVINPVSETVKSTSKDDAQWGAPSNDEAGTRKDLIASDYTWYCESDENNTTIWANFQGYNPNRELVEITTRNTCIYPEKPGIDYITITGFHISQAATNWAAPTAHQVGMVATHWNKGWIIENNVISDSKCSGITLGKERSSGHNVWNDQKGFRPAKFDGTNLLIEVIFKVLRMEDGWFKDNVGSHIVRNNRIFNCEQAGICGNMGAAFSIIENNHISDIWTKRQFGGYEIAGIKFHAPIDAIIRRNRIQGCKLGLWLDWQTQGTRVTGNLLYNNRDLDIYFEGNHGPYVCDNNIMMSKSNLTSVSQGGAFAHNLVSAGISVRSSPRTLPYHLPHSTELKGLFTILSGDDRWYNNLFIGNGTKENDPKILYKHGTWGYDDKLLASSFADNLYYNNARPAAAESSFVESAYKPDIQLVEKGDDVYLHLELDEAYHKHKGPIVTTELLGKTLISDLGFDNPDGTALKIDKDYFGNLRTPVNNSAGPFVNLGSGKVVLKVW